MKPKKTIKPVKAWMGFSDGKPFKSDAFGALDVYTSRAKAREFYEDARPVIISPVPKRVLHDSVSSDVLSEYQARDGCITIWVGLDHGKRIRVQVWEV